MGSYSDFPVVSPAIRRLKQFGIPVEARVRSAHRTPEAAAEFSKNAEKDGFGVIIAAAGKAAHLACVPAAHTTLPVIGIPVKSSTLDGLDALLATVQMPSGIPVATVAIDGADNAAILAAQMLALSDESIAKQLHQMKVDMEQGVAKRTKPCSRKLPSYNSGGINDDKIDFAKVRKAHRSDGREHQKGAGRCNLGRYGAV